MLKITNNIQYKNRNTLLSKQQISFGGINVDKVDASNLRNIKNQICAYCGKPMIEEHVYFSITPRDYEGKAGPVLKNLQHLVKYMRNTEKTVFNLLKRTAAKYPDEDLNGLLKKRYNDALKRLEEKQIAVINKALQQDLRLSEKNRLLLQRTMLKVQSILFEEPKEAPQKRTRIIEEFEKLKKTVKNDDKLKGQKQEIDKILNILKTLPRSSSFVDAFIIKYIQRSNSEIGQRLISPARRSLDHIKARKNKGQDHFSNLLVVCQKCNEEKGYTTYKDYITSHPKTPRNIEKNLRKVIREIKEGRLENFDEYPQQILDTLSKELPEKNKINLNI